MVSGPSLLLGVVLGAVAVILAAVVLENIVQRKKPLRYPDSELIARSSERQKLVRTFFREHSDMCDWEKFWYTILMDRLFEEKFYYKKAQSLNSRDIGEITQYMQMRGVQSIETTYEKVQMAIKLIGDSWAQMPPRH